MDPRIPRLRRKLAAIPFQPLRSHSFGEEHHKFLTHIGGSSAAPFYGLMPLERCSLMVMNPHGEPGAPRGFDSAGPGATDATSSFASSRWAAPTYVSLR